MDNSDMNFEVDAMNTVMTVGKTVLLGLAFSTLLSGCATPTSEDDFGNSVRRMIEAQKYIPPEQQGHDLPTLDGGKAETAINQYRSDTKSPDSKMNMDGYGSDAASQ